MYVSQLDRDNLEAELWEVETAVEEINKILRGEVDIKKIQQKEELIRKRREKEALLKELKEIMI